VSVCLAYNVKLIFYKIIEPTYDYNLIIWPPFILFIFRAISMQDFIYYQLTALVNLYNLMTSTCFGY